MLKHKYLKIALMICTVVAWCLMIEQSLLRIQFVLVIPGVHDTSLALTVARGIANGLTPYVDLFENKPPGFFLMLAASIKLFDSSLLLGQILQALSLVIYPAGLGYLAWRYTHANLRNLLIALSMIVGGMLAMIAAQTYEPYVAEVFGAFAGFLYLFTIALPGRATWPRILTAAFFLLAASGFKEPFAPVLVVSALVLFIDRPKFLLTRLVLPVVIAITTGLLMLYALGWIEAWSYYSYKQSSDTAAGIVYSQKTLLGIIQQSFAKNVQFWNDYSVFLLWFVAMLSTTICMHEYAVNHSLRNIFLIGAAIVFGGCVTLLMIGLRQVYYHHHYVFCVPFFTALYMKWLMQAKERPATQITTYVYILPTYFIAVLTLFTSHIYPFQKENPAWRGVDFSAITLDYIMDACHLERYLYLTGAFAYFTGTSAHSPYGPNFLQEPVLPETIEDSYTRKRYIYNLQHAKLIVVNPSLISNANKGNIPTLLGSDFTLDAPPCAQPYLSKIPDYKLYFRINPVTDTTPPPMPY